MLDNHTMTEACAVDESPGEMMEVMEEESEDEADVFVPVPIAWCTSESPSVDEAKAEMEQNRSFCNDFSEPNSINDPSGTPLPHVAPPAIVSVDPRCTLSLQVLPLAARELLASSMQRICYTARLSYSLSRRYRKYTEIGNNFTGFSIQNEPVNNYVYSTINSLESQIHDEEDNRLSKLPCFSNLSWVERQLVEEWRTYRPHDSTDAAAAVYDDSNNNAMDDDDVNFALARSLVPPLAPRPVWQKSDACFSCRQLFGPARLRHHCRLCGRSYCQPHCAYTHSLPQFGHDPSVPERVCDSCKSLLLEQNLAERVAWRLARCRDFQQGLLQPYFETGQDSIEQILLRITEAALAVGRSIPLGAQAAVAVETVDVLRKYGLNGMYTIMLRQEFLAAADLLQKALGINQSAWPLSVHELSAAIFYALAQHRAMRGLNPEREHLIHSYASNRHEDSQPGVAAALCTEHATEENNIYQSDAAISDLVSDGLTSSECDRRANKHSQETSRTDEMLPCRPVCEPVTDETLASLIFYAPMALNFIYATKEVDMQLLAAQQGWRLVYAYMEQESGHKNAERPASALFVHEEQKIACIAVRGTATIHDVITDIRQTPVSFPDEEEAPNKKVESDWTTIFRGHGLAVCGMAGAALNLHREHIDSILHFARRGYRIRLTGHSLGGGVSVLLGALVYRDLERELNAATVPLKVYAYGTPSCIDARLAESVESFVVTVVLHDDVIPRLTPTSCRQLLKHLLTIRETWVKEHFPEDFLALQERAKTAWAPTFRNSFTLKKSSIRTYCRKTFRSGRRRLFTVTEKLLNDTFLSANNGSSASDSADDVERTASVESSMQQALHDTLDSAVTVVNADSDANEPPRLLLDYMGGIDDRSPGLVIDGDEFFDPTDDLIEGSDCESVSSVADVQELGVQATQGSRELFDGTTDARTETAANGSDVDVEENDCDDEDSPGAVMLDETPLPRMFVPGKIVHIYAHRGVYKCAYVPRAFKELRRITMAGNMLSNHKAKPYYEALLELRSVRLANEHPPRWTAFDEDDSCSCCASRFTWASTSSSRAQEARDKHNCRSCGTLVCDPCSTNRLALPSIGLCALSRVCDRCYNDISGVSTSELTSSFIAPKQTVAAPPVQTLFAVNNDKKPIRERERRSAVVDELASRVHASPLTCS
ncbi:hypothetical protein MPSEU_000804100 [Mayamaea pseudoterrestris]|nr:hypothetical protein MPSEU_000804100 [Mayamaea pseudoterrestris]